MTDNVASAFCYVPVLGGLVFLLMEPYNRNKLIRFHAFQALLLAAAMFVLNMLLTSFIHLLFAFYGIFSLLQWTYFIASAYVAYKAYTGEKVVLPVIGPFAEKQA